MGLEPSAELRALLEPRFELDSLERVNAVLPYPLDSAYMRLGSPALGVLDRLERGEIRAEHALPGPRGPGGAFLKLAEEIKKSFQF